MNDRRSVHRTASSDSGSGTICLRFLCFGAAGEDVRSPRTITALRTAPRLLGLRGIRKKRHPVPSKIRLWASEKMYFDTEPRHFGIRREKLIVLVGNADNIIINFAFGADKCPCRLNMI
jgi:hypothetical protein